MTVKVFYYRLSKVLKDFAHGFKRNYIENYTKDINKTYGDSISFIYILLDNTIYILIMFKLFINQLLWRNRQTQRT